MFTLTFVRDASADQGLSSKLVMCAARYTVGRSGDRMSIWAYPTLRPEGAILVDLHPDEDECTYHELFVTNEAGKTIDRVQSLCPPSVVHAEWR